MESDLVKKHKPTLAWVMPVYGNIHRTVYESHMAAMGNLAKNGVVATPKFVCVTNKMGLASASNAIVNAVLEVGCDYVFWTEMDMLLPSQGPITLLEHAIKYKLDVLSGVYFLRGSGQPCLFRKVVEVENPYAYTPFITYPNNAIFEVGCPGMGCVLFASSVFEQIAKPWFDDQEGMCGQDMYFYTKLRDKGIKIHADSTVVCGQIDEDEPKIWGLETYTEWAKGHSSSGFVNSTVKTVDFAEPENKFGVRRSA